MGCGSASAKEPASGAQPGQPPNRGPPSAPLAKSEEGMGDGKKMIYNKETGHFEEAKDNLEKKDRPNVKSTYKWLG